ncbi:hypothetical protein F4802DRAFT_546474 [Xylaria palmicola]|nr:hypothetical protein F4802DRAFT_546474 [Xylaria palmicola]
MVVKFKGEDFALPPVAAKRPKRKYRRSPTIYTYAVDEALKYYGGVDKDLVWGPFYNSFRELRKRRAQWADFNLGTIWKGIPASTQTRPGVVGRFLNRITRADPPPAITLLPPTEETRRAEPRAQRSVDSWQEEIRITDDWSPAQINFEQWYGRLKHPTDYNDDFYSKNYDALYQRICDWAETWFGGNVHLEDMGDTPAEASGWEVPMTDQFVQYARMVAREDRGYVEWKDIINDPRHRKWLCVGIFAQIIERRIFNQLLFGVTESYKAELDRHDSRWLDEEGFTRKEGRRQIVRAALGERLIPGQFWNGVDDLTGQTVLIFQPLLVLMCVAKGRVEERECAVFWQEVHTLLAIAAYFQVCTAVSPSIFHVLSATPGSRFQWEEERPADLDIYNNSKNFHHSHEERWRALADITSRGDDLGADDDDEEGDEMAAAIASYMPLPTDEGEYRLMEHQRNRGGRVMYTVFPKLTRYSAENVGELVRDDPRHYRRRRRDRLGSSPPGSSDEDEDDPAEVGEGMRINILSRGLVIYYHGLLHAQPGSGADGVPLDAHLDAIARARMPGGILPFWTWYWSPVGEQYLGLSWPLWPRGVDRFWLYWALYAVVTQTLRLWAWFYPAVVTAVFGYGGEGPRRLCEAFLLRPLSWLLLDAATYVAMRAAGVHYLGTDWIYPKMMGVTFALVGLVEVLLRYGNAKDPRLFAYACAPLFWLDETLFRTIPQFIMASAGVIQRGEVPSLRSGAARLVTGAVMAITG